MKMKKIQFPRITKNSKNSATKNGQPDNTAVKPVSFSQQLLGAVIIFMCITWGYSLLTEKKATPTIPLSSFAQLINSREITTVTVEGSSLTGVKIDGTKVTSKKEDGASVFSTLAAYGVSSTTLATTTITISSDRGLSFWGSIIPIVLPILFLGFMIWWLARGIKGANVQALSFGQSRAKVIYPDDTKEKVTFKDVAGAKEAKQELEEIVDFLKNPTKYKDL